MKEQDHKYILGIKTALKREPDEASILVVKRLLTIIDRLDKQLANLVEVGEPFGKVAELISDATRQELWVHTQNPKPDVPLVFTIGRAKRDPYDVAQVILLEKNFRRLAQALKGVKDDIS